MIILNTVGDTLVTQSSAASTITASVYGIETTSGVDSYKKLGQNQVAQTASTTTLYTVPASSSTVASVFVFTNTTASSATVTLWHVPNGGSVQDSNAIFKAITVAANESLVWNKGNFQRTTATTGGGGSGDVTGPGSSTDNAISLFDGTTGKVIKNSTVIINPAGIITGVTSLIIADGATLVYGGNSATMRQRLGLEIGVNVQAFDVDLSALAAMTTTGMVARTASATFLPRTLTGTAEQVNIANGDGVAGNPVFSLPQSIGVSSIVTFAGVTIGTLNGVIHGVSGALSASPVLLGSEVSGVLPLANGGVGATVAVTARDNLGLGVSSIVTFAGMTLGVLNGPLRGISGRIGATLISLTTDVSGALPIANGGTGTTTAILAFNALSPTTTRGDLITRDATNNVRLAVGSTFTVLRSNGVDPSWGKLDVTSDVTGLLPLRSGGTGTSLGVSAGALVYSGASFMAYSPVGTSGMVLQSVGATQPVWVGFSTLVTGINHNTLSNLAVGDVHTQYALLAGRSGGQVITGSVDASENLTLRSTSDGTKGFINIDEDTDSSDASTGALVVAGGVGVAKNIYTTGSLTVDGTASGGIINVTTNADNCLNVNQTAGTGLAMTLHSQVGAPFNQTYVLLTNSNFSSYGILGVRNGTTFFQHALAEYMSIEQQFGGLGNFLAGTFALNLAGAATNGTFDIKAHTNSVPTIFITAISAQTNLVHMQDTTSGTVMTLPAVQTGTGTFNFGAVFNDSGNNVNFRVEGDSDPFMFFGYGASSRICIGHSLPAYKLDVRNGEVAVGTAGNGIRIKEGTNAKLGTNALSSGVAIVATTAVGTTSRIFLTAQDGSANIGDVWISARTAGASFQISSSNVLDARTVAWWIVDPA